MTRGEKVIAFIERYCRVPEGKLIGQPLKLMEFQRKFILEVYDNPAGTSRGYLCMGRKNGKTALIACLVLAHLVGPEAVENSQIVSGARSRDQAALVFKLALKMVHLSPELTKIVRPTISMKMLAGLPMNTEFKALAAEGSTSHGLSPVLAILDEVGQVKGPQDDFIEAVETAQGAYDDPLLLVISTQAPTDADMMSIWLDDAERSNDPRIVSHLYTAPEGCEVDDTKAWAAANPALGVFRSLPDVQDQAAKAKRMPSAENGFRVLILNQRVNPFAPFVSASTWKIGNREVGDLGNRVFGGLDLSSTTDLTCLVLTGRVEGELRVKAWFWMPEANVSESTKRDRAPYDVWVRQGFIKTTPGKVVDYAFVARDIAEIVAPYNIISLAFDRWRMDRLKLQFEAIGLDLPMTSFGQGYMSMAPALDALEEDLLNEELAHGGNPPLTMCAANAVAIKDPAGNRKLDKSKATGRIDGMVALAMARGAEAMMMEDDTPTPWDEDANFRMADL